MGFYKLKIKEDKSYIQIQNKMVKSLRRIKMSNIVF